MRAAARGRVTFADRVAGELHVTIEHDGGFRTSYSFLSSIRVRVGEEVERGEVIGASGPGHPGSSAPPHLHFGLRRGEDYMDPAPYLLPLRVRLAPLEEARGEGGGTGSGRWAGEAAGAEHGRGGSELSFGPSLALARSLDADGDCRLDPGVEPPPPPSSGYLVAVPGLGSATGRGALASFDFALLGYPRDRVRIYSYAGLGRARADDPALSLHAPYRPDETTVSLELSAERLAQQLRALKAEDPGAEVDLVAHSQGGLVAAVFLLRLYDPADPSFPRVRSFLSFDSPFAGVELARLAEGFRMKGRVRFLARVAGFLGYDPAGPSVLQMAGRRRLPAELEEGLPRALREKGVRAGSVAAIGDLVVPATAARLPGGERFVVRAGLFEAHSQVVCSPEGRAVAYGFLSGGRPQLPPWRMAAADLVGAVLSAAEGSAVDALLARMGGSP